MPQPTPAEIEKLCDDWCAAAISADKIGIGANTEKFRLLANSVKFHELTHDRLCAALVGLTKTLYLPRMNTFVSYDHYALWSWCGELLLDPTSQLFSNEQHEIRLLYKTTLHAALAHCQKPSSTEEEWKKQREIDSLQSHHAKQLVQEALLVLAYLSFPLLEAVLKRACSNYVTLDGQVLSSFSVPKKKGGPRKYTPSERCSSLRDLLFLHSDIASPKLKTLINHFRAHLASIHESEDPFDLVFSWRNQSLHGSTSFQTIGGFILNLSLMISIFEIEQDFEQRRSRVLEHCRWEAQSQQKSPWSFYPPY